MKKTLVFLIFIMTIGVFAQKDSIYYYKGNFIPADNETAVMKKVVEVINDSVFKITKSFRNRSNNWKKYFIRTIHKKDNTIFDVETVHVEYEAIWHAVIKIKKDSVNKKLYNITETNDNGIVTEEGQVDELFPMRYQGKITRRYSNGKLKEVAIYKDGIFISNKNWLNNGDEYIANISPLYDKAAEVTGGVQ